MARHRRSLRLRGVWQARSHPLVCVTAQASTISVLGGLDVATSADIDVIGLNNLIGQVVLIDLLAYVCYSLSRERYGPPRGERFER